ncbi:MAG TPA: serine/threonine-protein kinase [Thermoanaerobaculia bacterium]|nr:serine/threonine-protein kinase [Thermoanaerobaculia bacterium]
MPPSPPPQLGRYEIREELGKGAMGIVYLARDPLIGRLVALKTFRLGFSVGDRDIEQFRARFIREAQSAGILSHPGIVTVHDVVERSEEGLAFIAMEYVRGTNLKILLQGDAPLDLAFVADVISQIAAALDYAHAHGVIHRDVKPANVILTGDGKVKLTDFGIARLNSSNLTQEGQMLGTPNYMAPEQVMGKDVDHRADLFSLGVVLYEMLTGHKPFAGENLTQVSHRIVYEPFTPPEKFVRDLPPALRAVLVKALEKNPADRYSTASELARDLTAAVAGRNRSAHRDLNETQSVDAFPPPMLLPDLPPAPPLPATEALFMARGGGDSSDASLHETIVAPAATVEFPSHASGAPAAAIPRAPVAAATLTPPPIPVVAPPVVEFAAPIVEPPVLPVPAIPTVAPTPPVVAARRPGPRVGYWLALIAGTIAVAGVAAAAFLLTLNWVGAPISRSLAPETQAVESEVIRLRQEGLQRLASGDAAGAAVTLARAVTLAPGHVGLRDLAKKANEQAVAFAGAAGRTAEVQEGLAAAQAALAEKRYDEAAMAAIGVLTRQPGNAAANDILLAVQQAKSLTAPPGGRPGRAPGTRRPTEGQIGTDQLPVEATETETAPAAESPTGPAVLNISFTTETADGVLIVYLDSRTLLRETFHFKTGGFLRSRTTGGSIQRQITLAPGASGQLRVYVTPAGKPAQVKTWPANFTAGSTHRLVIDLPASGAVNAQLQ